jgi:predicted enzyme related to lactoylglutathione lyase
MGRPIHFEIHASDPGRAIAFYQQILGWTFEQWGEQQYWVITTGPKEEPGIDGGLVPRPTQEAPELGAPVSSFVVTVQVDDLDTTVKEAIAAGGDVRLPRMPVPGIGWLAYVGDTEGNILGLMQPDPTAPVPGA